MKLSKSVLACVLLLAGLAVAPAVALTTYGPVTVTSQTFLSIPASTHQLGCSSDTAISTAVYDNGGSIQPRSSRSVSVSSGNVSISWSNAFTGTVKLVGCFTGDTSVSTDFDTTLHLTNTQLAVCHSCSANSGGYAQRTVSSVGYRAANEVTVTINSSCTGTLYNWMDPDTQKVVFGFSSGIGSNCVSGTSGSHHEVRYGVTGFPTGGVNLSHVAYSGGSFSSLVDDRPF